MVTSSQRLRPAFAQRGRYASGTRGISALEVPCSSRSPRPHAPGPHPRSLFERWCQHTRDWDLRDHPEIGLNRPPLTQGDGPCAGIAENHWPDRATLDAGTTSRPLQTSVPRRIRPPEDANRTC